MSLQKNWCKPRLKKISDLAGFAVETASAGETVKVQVAGSLTSFDPTFHKICRSILSLTQSQNVDSLLVRIDKKGTAKIFENNFPIVAKTLAKRKIKKGGIVLDRDIADIGQISFHLDDQNVNPKNGEKVIWLFRFGYIFGIYFDFTGDLIFEDASREMARLYKRVLYYDLYDALEEGKLDSLIARGWFPFINLIGQGHDQLLALLKESKLDRLEAWSEEAFPNERIQKLSEGWFDNASFQKKKKTIEEGLANFYEGKFIAAISTLTPMVEGIANENALQKTGKGIRTSSGARIAEGIAKIAKEKVAYDSLIFPDLFQKYLTDYYFQQTKSDNSKIASRNPVSHGKAKDESFTRERTLQVILTLDQIRFYL